MSMDAYDRMRRTCRTTSSWFQRARAIALHTELPKPVWEPTEGGEEGWSLVGYEVGQMLYKVLADVDMLVPLLNDYEAEEIEPHARDLVAALRKRRLVKLMENDDGRTDAEKAAFAAARERLKSK